MKGKVRGRQSQVRGGGATRSLPPWVRDALALSSLLLSTFLSFFLSFSPTPFQSHQPLFVPRRGILRYGSRKRERLSALDSVVYLVASTDIVQFSLL